MDLKKELLKIKEKIDNGKQVTPEEIRFFCNMHEAVVTIGEKDGEIKKITSFCPQNGLLNICIFKFNKGKGKKVCSTSISPSLTFEKQLLAVMQRARELNEEKEGNTEGLYV